MAGARLRSNTAMTDKSLDVAMYNTRGMTSFMSNFHEVIGYNPETKELWGRNGIRWLLLGAFYVCFYTCLIVFYLALWYMWTLVILNRDSPEYSGPEDGLAWTPGVSHIPVLDPERTSSLIYYKRSNDTQIGEIKDYMYNSFLESYEPKYWTSENGNFIDCSAGRTDSDPEKVCEFKLDDIRPCVYEDDYGWADGQPCIILKLNKVNNWEPENYDSIDEVPEEIKDIWQKDRIALKCFGTDPISKERMGQVNYYPYAGWSFDYYPFTGQQGYKSPLVAVQFMELPHRVLLFITCKAYTKNMVYVAQYGLGMTRFEIISD